MHNLSSSRFSRTRTLTATVLLALCMTLLINQSAKAQDDLYTIELLIYVNDNGASNELWNSHIELGYPSRLAFIGKGSQQDTMTALPAERRKLNAAADKIARSSAQRIVFHKAWRQRLEPIDDAASVVIHGGKTHGPHYELEGSIKFSRNRYLHITTDLWLSRFGPQAIGSDQAWPPLPPIPQRNGRRSSSGDYASIRAAQATRIVKMEEYRRMRSDEIHYLDHPLFGLLVTISKAELGDNETDTNDDEIADATAQNP